VLSLDELFGDAHHVLALLGELLPLGLIEVTPSEIEQARPFGL
jgi:hypothetical protein